jgi:mRNA-degrading endonuclease RelE of RelBE toxin-antitoxin system
MYGKLPRQIRELAIQTYALFLRDPSHPMLGRHTLDDIARGRHRSGSWSVRITQKYRAIYAVDGNTNVWYWVGSHNDYENFTGRK